MVTVDAGQEDVRTTSPTEWTGLPAQRSAAGGDRLGRALRFTSVLVVDNDASSRRLIVGTLGALGVGSIMETSALVGLREITEEHPAGDLALVSLGIGRGAPAIIAGLRTAGWHRVLGLAPTADIGPVIDAVGAGVHGVLIDRRANPAAANVPASIHDLSAREIEVIQLVAEGRSNKWIGEQLQLSSLTVKSHLARIGRKLGTGDRAHIVAMALRAGVIS